MSSFAGEMGHQKSIFQSNMKFFLSYNTDLGSNLPGNNANNDANYYYIVATREALGSVFIHFTTIT